MDLLLFVNIHHLRRADETLAALGLGRAHHRVLYFVARQPNAPVAALLAILGITKQSFGRVGKELIQKNLLRQRPGERDRRQRLLSLTPEGVALEQELFQELHDNIARAYAASGPDAVSGFWIVSQYLIGEEGRSQFRAVQNDVRPTPVRGK
jgi:DNA-binding MarR family transcriptional regulator